MTASGRRKQSSGKSALHGSAPDRAHTALLITDLISDFDFEDGRSLSRAALPIARRIRLLSRRARAAGVPVIYVNDNFGRWRSDFRQLVQHCAEECSLGAPIVQLLLPQPGDYFVLKPKHSAFFATPLEILLGCMDVRKLILTGVTSHQCILFTAHDAYLREYELSVPRDCIASPLVRDTRNALEHLERTLRADVRASRAVRFSARAAGTSG